eukprot:GEMP01041493.1.p1 GENE.GEMP01041493.1~~GEMP01041493.1.p1  ORF type:complete len:212 (+),score=40.44 GEMP01041493.1:89-724(+)
MGHKESKSLPKQASTRASTMDGTHFILKNSLYPPFPEGSKSVMLGMGCFWCSEALFMDLKSGIISTHVGYAGGELDNPTYQDICTGRSGHAEVTRVIFDPTKIKFSEILGIFWETHDPTTLNQQGGDRGTQYRSCIFVDDPDLLKEAQKSKEIYGQALTADGRKPIVTEIVSPAPKFWYAEDNHQQYDAKPNSRQYCGLQPTGIRFPSASM